MLRGEFDEMRVFRCGELREVVGDGAGHIVRGERERGFGACATPATSRPASTCCDTGRLVSAVGATFPLADVPKALHHLETGQTRGKIAITV